MCVLVEGYMGKPGVVASQERIRTGAPPPFLCALGLAH